MSYRPFHIEGEYNTTLRPGIRYNRLPRWWYCL